jgi:hypothetical protein
MAGCFSRYFSLNLHRKALEYTHLYKSLCQVVPWVLQFTVCECTICELLAGNRKHKRFVINFWKVFRYSSLILAARIATRWGLKVSGFEILWRRDIPYTSRWTPRPPSSMYNRYRRYFLGSKQQGRGVDILSHLAPRKSTTIHLPLLPLPLWRVIRWKSDFTYS